MISEVLEKFRDWTAMVFFDDILVYTKGKWEEHLEQVREVLEKLEAHDFKLNKKKLTIGVKEVKFLGAIIGQVWIKIDSTKMKVIWKWPVPTKIKKVQAFLGLTNYYRKFIKDYARITTPLTTLLKKENRFKWDKEQQNAFRTLKGQFIENKLLVLPNPAWQFRVNIDASIETLGAVFSQEHEGKWKLVAFHSQQLSLAEWNYVLWLGLAHRLLWLHAAPGASQSLVAVRGA
jgi:hypothetical protein